MIQWIILIGKLLLLFFVVWFFWLECERAKKHKKSACRVKKRLGATIALLLVVALLLSSASAQFMASVYEFWASRYSSPPIEEEHPLPLAVPPAQTADGFQAKMFALSEVEDSELLGLVGESLHYRNTSIEEFDCGRRAIYVWFEQKKSNGETFKLHEDVVFSTNERSTDYCVVDTLEGYDKQILGAKDAAERATDQKTKTKNYHQMAVAALNGLQLCKKMKSEDFLYWNYAEIAFTALVNKYIYTISLIGQSDLFYRVSQIADYLNEIADTVELKYAMYFLSAAMVYLSYQTLDDSGFPKTSDDLVYRSESWKYTMRFLYRFGICMTDVTFQEGFMKRIQQCRDRVLELELTEAEKQEVTKESEPADKWFVFLQAA